MMKQNFLSHTKKLFRTIFLLAVTFMLLSACSEDETDYTGRLSIEFTHWEPEWTDHLFILVSPLDHKEIVIKQLKADPKTANNIDLNVGNYIILIKSDDNDYTPHITKYVQIQNGKTEVIKI